MRIGLDIDGPCADFEGHFLEYLDLPRHGAESWHDPRFRHNFHIIRDNISFWLSIPPSVDPTKLKFTPVVYVTARPVASAITRHWLSANGFPEAPIITVGVDGSKVNALKDKVDYFIDDAIHNFEELNAAGINCLLLSRSHNKGYDAGDKRVADLIDFQTKYL